MVLGEGDPDSVLKKKGGQFVVHACQENIHMTQKSNTRTY